MRDVSAERDRAQERLSEWETKHATPPTGTPSPVLTVAPARVANAVPVSDDPALQARIF